MTVVFAAIVAVALGVFGMIAIRKKLKYSMFFIDRMRGEKFERFVAELYEALGYKTTNTSLSGDQGIDVIIKKGFLKKGLQVKRYRSPVGNSAVQEAVAGKKFYKLNKVAVITNSTFTKAARALAKANGVELIDREGLMALIGKVKEKK